MGENNEYKWMVRVSCMTFNHAPYIVDAMNGFTMQQTDFPYVCTIFDDASTDGEQEVIKNYLNEHFELEDKDIARHEETDDCLLTFARHKTNLNCFFAVIFLKYNHYSIKKPKFPYIAEWNDNTKYVAICEGDDYWIDPKKLQSQYDYLENHPEYTMCFSAVNHIDTHNDIISVACHSKEDCDFSAHDIIHEGGLFVPHCTLFCVRKVFKEKPKFRKMADVGDSPLNVLLAIRGKVHYFATPMASYRINNPESWSGNVKKDVDKRIQHFVCGCKWYKELDEFTKKEFHHDVYYRICLASGFLYHENVITAREFLCNVRELNWGREKWHFICHFCANVFSKNCPTSVMKVLSKTKRTLKTLKETCRF